jgi:hypothetical protein
MCSSCFQECYLIFAVDCNLTVYLFCTFLFTLSGSSHFCHWDVQSISRTLTLCPVGFRSLSLSLSLSLTLSLTHTHTHIRTHSPTHSTCPQLSFTCGFKLSVLIYIHHISIFREGMFMVLGSSILGWNTRTMLLKGHMQLIRYVIALEYV